MSDLNTSSQTKKKITLTGRRAVEIVPSNWPVIARATDTEHDNEFEFQANRIAKWHVIVRQHQNGCALVYGIYTYYSAWRDEKSYDMRGGLKLGKGEDIIAAIRSVSTDMYDRVRDVRPEDAIAFRRLAHECIADLPAEECGCEELAPAIA